MRRLAGRVSIMVDELAEVPRSTSGKQGSPTVLTAGLAPPHGQPQDSPLAAPEVDLQRS